MSLVRSLRTSVRSLLWRSCTATTTHARYASGPTTASTEAASTEAASTEAASTEPQAEPAKTEQEVWVNDIPTRAIASMLLDCKDFSMEHRALFDKVSETGLFRSHRQFKKSLKMLRRKNRAVVLCQGPVRVGSAERTFFVKLTVRGQVLYSAYRERGGAPDGSALDMTGIEVYDKPQAGV